MLDIKNIRTFKKIILSFLFIVIPFSHSQIISEIMYDPAGSDTGNEWIEIFNNTSSSIDLTTYKLFESNTNHSISNSSLYTNTNGSILLAGEYAIVVDNPATFLANHAGFSGKLFDSSFSLINSGEELILKNSALSSIFNINYIPLADANNTGGTLNYINNIWQAYRESPSASSILEVIINTNSNTSNTNSSTTNSTSTNTNTSSSNTNTNNYLSYSSNGSNRYVLGDLKLLAPREINTVVGAETDFFVKSIDSRNNPVITSVYWSFGDGAEGIGTSTKHRYQNAGIYTAFVESEVSNSYGVDKVLVKVENPNIEISEVTDNYVEIFNRGDIELNIGRFIIASDQGLYHLSRMFIIEANSKVKVDGRVLGFSKLTNVKLMSAYNTLITKYENKNILNNITQDTDTISVNNQIINATNSKKLPLKVISTGLLPKRNTKLNPLRINGTTTVSNSLKNLKSSNLKEFKVDNTKNIKNISNTGENTPTNFAKKWLYWIYE